MNKKTKTKQIFNKQINKYLIKKETNVTKNFIF